MRVLTFNRKARIDPITFALGVIPYVSVAHRRQFTGGLL